MKTFDSIVVAQDILIPSAVAGDDFVLNCDTTAIELDGSNSEFGALIDYEWTFEDGTIISNNVISSQVSSIGDYILTVTNGVNGCIGTDTINLSSDHDAHKRIKKISLKDSQVRLWSCNINSTTSLLRP